MVKGEQIKPHLSDTHALVVFPARTVSLLRLVDALFLVLPARAPKFTFPLWRKDGDMCLSQVRCLSRFAFIGIWRENEDDGGQGLKIFAILTTAANSLVSPVHNRMPVLVRSHDTYIWLQSTCQELLEPVRRMKAECKALSQEMGKFRGEPCGYEKKSR
jgi:hypothetical protein